MRAQVVPDAYKPYVGVVGDPELDALNGDKSLEVGARLTAQEMAVDGLRSSDWAVRLHAFKRTRFHAHTFSNLLLQVTLVLMTLEMWKLAHHANNDTTAVPFLDQYWCATLQPIMVFLGGIPRFYLNDFRQRNGNKLSTGLVWLGIIAFLVACGLFGLTTGSLLDFIWRNGTPPDENLRLLDARVLTALILVQIGYPLVYIFSLVYLHCYGRPYDWPDDRSFFYPPGLSFLKDMAYGTLDVTTKAGLALYTASRVMHV